MSKRYSLKSTKERSLTSSPSLINSIKDPTALIKEVGEVKLQINIRQSTNISFMYNLRQERALVLSGHEPHF